MGAVSDQLTSISSEMAIQRRMGLIDSIASDVLSEILHPMDHHDAQCAEGECKTRGGECR
jgi:hypothetical protein